MSVWWFFKVQRRAWRLCMHAGCAAGGGHGVRRWGMAHYIMDCFDALGAVSDAPDDASIASSSALTDSCNTLL